MDWFARDMYMRTMLGGGTDFVGRGALSERKSMWICLRYVMIEYIRPIDRGLPTAVCYYFGVFVLVARSDIGSSWINTLFEKSKYQT